MACHCEKCGRPCDCGETLCPLCEMDTEPSMIPGTGVAKSNSIRREVCANGRHCSCQPELPGFDKEDI